MKTNDPSANLVAQIGADWWLNSTAQYSTSVNNNPVVGGGDFVKLTTQWQTVSYSSLSATQLKADPPPGLEPDPTTPTTPTTPTVTPAVTQATASPGTGVERAGDTITLSLGFSEAVTVTGTPTLSLNDGGKATYVGGSGTSTLTFKTTVASTDTNTSALAITGVNLPSGSSIKDASGVAANLSGAVKTFSGLQIDPILPAVTQASASPATGTELVGDTITLSLGFNEAVTVTGTPTLSLNDGGTATYAGGSGTGTLTFKTTVASTNTTTSALAITGVNLPSGASIKDSSGVAANLSGAVKTFTGLQIDPPTSPTTPVSGGGTTTPTSPTTPTTPTTPTPSATKPALTIADSSLYVAGRGGTVDLGTKVSTTDSNDVVTVNITGLPKYETITDKLDGRTFQGNNITLTAAQVDSGLTLTSNYRGGGHPTATLTLTASAKDPTSGAVATASPQTITVTDPRPAATATTTTSPTTTAADPSHPTGTSTGVPAVQSGQHQDPVTSTGTISVSPPTDLTDRASTIAARVTSLAGQDLAVDHGSALFSQIRDLIGGGGVATSVPQPISVTDFRSSTGTSTASLASQSFALLNQYLASNSGRVDSGQIVAAVSQATGWGQESLLARPQH
ncbi:hypothetical protein QA640_31300 [Bradyrhizobium sp. CB82]|uniref:hypothetical protein n=1 Tax=Bradyrhizobium sp. CB82 TaxID=3039159 RepID=UPI0024B0A681|nr:hypothetical protein [Bradyrhizobium sp. CB82]WFU38859.1 hypothetical protein QA640_31300 [Bradyrhizobium sp. CB82]